MPDFFSPNRLKAELASLGGVAYNDKYMVTIGQPAGFMLNPIANRRLSILCENVTLPTKSLATFEKSIYGPVKAMPYRMTFTEASMSFIMTDSMEEKDYFDTWQNRIVDQKTGNLGFFDDYVVDISIKKFGRNVTSSDDDPTYEIILIDAWPSIVSEIQLSHSGGTEAMKLPVTFQFKKWKAVSGTASFARPVTSTGAIGT